MGIKREPFIPDTIYHIYNRGNGGCNIFNTPDNYKFFLKKFSHYISPVSKTYAYCLLPNHFHFLIHIRPETYLIDLIRKKKLFEQIEQDYPFDEFITSRFKYFFISYAKSFNKVFNRHGSLFEESIKRKEVSSDNYFTTLIRYIHFNPVFHGLRKEPFEWKYSSYNAFFCDNKTELDKRMVMDWFGGKEKFIEFHKRIREDEIAPIEHLLFD
jgi:putative transposase